MGKNIAILGAGFAGLSAAWHLLQRSDCSVTLFDPKGIGGGASGIATGLLHPYVGEQGRRSLYATEGIAAAMALIGAVEEELQEEVAVRGGILRYAQNAEQKEKFSSYEDVERVGEDLFLIRSGVTVDCPRYLEGLWQLVKKRGAKLVQTEVQDLSSLSAFDEVIAAAGGGMKKFPEFSHLRVSYLKGQVLVCKGERAPSRSLIGKGYLAVGKEGKCFAGSTYEKDVVNDIPDLEKAQREIFPKIATFFPEIDAMEVTGCKAALRVVRPGHYFPLVEQVREGLWAFTGLGSRGLLYHALLGQQLADNPSLALT